MADIQDAGALLQRAGFALPVVDRDRISVTYEHAFALMYDLRRMGEGNALAGRRRHFSRRGTFMAAAEEYLQRFADSSGRLHATFEIVYLTGWAPAEGQPRPLMPGSAQNRLADALGAQEQAPARDRGRRLRGLAQRHAAEQLELVLGREHEELAAHAHRVEPPADADGRPEEAPVDALAPQSPNVVLVNCLPPSKLEPCLEVLQSSGLPFGVYANLGEPAEDGNYRHTEDRTPEEFAGCLEPWIAAGARIVGGCCGTQPAHIGALAQRLAQNEIRPS